MPTKEEIKANMKITGVVFSTWYWSKADVKSENELEERLGLDLSKPGYYAQRQKEDKSGYLKAHRFASAEARDKYIARESKRIMQARGKNVCVTQTLEH